MRALIRPSCALRESSSNKRHKCKNSTNDIQVTGVVCYVLGDLFYFVKGCISLLIPSLSVKTQNIVHCAGLKESTLVSKYWFSSTGTSFQYKIV